MGCIECVETELAMLAARPPVATRSVTWSGSPEARLPPYNHTTGHTAFQHSRPLAPPFPLSFLIEYFLLPLRKRVSREGISRPFPSIPGQRIR